MKSLALKVNDVLPWLFLSGAQVLPLFIQVNPISTRAIVTTSTQDIWGNPWKTNSLST
jgi:hypothetical protein